jgi:hypothetical protein
MTKRHPFHSICPYFAMFPEQFVEQQLLSFTSPGDLVFDPFCGRGTTVFESLLKGRRAAGSDVNSVAACIASAKAAAPAFGELVARIDALEELHKASIPDYAAPTPFFEVCFERETLAEILFVREALDWKGSPVDGFLAAVMLGILHGESHKSELCLSNRMPRTISTKPDYSVRWWGERKLEPPRRQVFDTLRKAVAFRYRMPPASARGVVRQADARTAGSTFSEFAGQVKLVVTSPPYLDTTDYAEDQWLRLWFLGGKSHPQLRKNRDDRHTQATVYWEFLREAWAGLNLLMADNSTIVIRIGGAKLTKEQLLTGVTDSLNAALQNFELTPLHGGVTSSIRPRETSAFRPAPPRQNVEHDFVFRLRRHGTQVDEIAA